MPPATYRPYFTYPFKSPHQPLDGKPLKNVSGKAPIAIGAHFLLDSLTNDAVGHDGAHKKTENSEGKIKDEQWKN